MSEQDTARLEYHRINDISRTLDCVTGGEVAEALGATETTRERDTNRLLWERAAAKSAIEFVRRYARECCRHTEAVADCPHCNLLFLASYAERAGDALAALEQRASVTGYLHDGNQ